MTSLLDRLLKAGDNKLADVAASSKFFEPKDVVQTDLPVLNIAFSGSLDGGVAPGLTVIAGKTKCYKTLISLYCMRAYLDKYPEGVAVLYDSEFGITVQYLRDTGIDPSRVIHIPVADIEEFKFDVVARLGELTPKDRVFIMVDSIGNLASKKELKDAEEGNSAQDMSRAKSLKSLFRIITPKLNILNIPCVIINHVYDTQETYSKPVVSGGQGIQLSANQIFIISKAQEKDGDQLSGWRFTITLEKSRTAREKAKLSFVVLYDGGIQKHSSLFDLALESGHLVKATQGWYNTVDLETGETAEPKRRKADIEGDDAFFEGLLADSSFKRFVEGKYKLGGRDADDDA